MNNPYCSCKLTRVRSQLGGMGTSLLTSPSIERRACGRLSASPSIERRLRFAGDRS